MLRVITCGFLLSCSLLAADQVPAGGRYAAVRDELLAIGANDQKLRQQIPEVEKKHGRDSQQMQDLWRRMDEADAVNAVKVEAILAKHGWLGPKDIGPEANSSIFLVIQHADLEVQQKYLPIIREAVADGRAVGSALALLEDRVALREGRLQSYGSQIGYDEATDSHYVMPLIDPDNVDARRSSVGLLPLADYVRRWGISWDPVAYSQVLPTLKNPFAPDSK